MITHHPHTQTSPPLFAHLSQHLILSHPHLYQHVGCIVEAHDQSSHSCHVVHIGKGNEGDCCHVMQEHDQKILGTQLSRRINTSTKESTLKSVSWLSHCMRPRAASAVQTDTDTLMCAHTIHLCAFAMDNLEKLGPKKYQSSCCQLIQTEHVDCGAQ